MTNFIFNFNMFMGLKINAFRVKRENTFLRTDVLDFGGRHLGISHGQQYFWRVGFEEYMYKFSFSSDRTLLLLNPQQKLLKEYCQYTPKWKCPNWAQVSIFLWPPLLFSTAIKLLGMEFTRASQVATGTLFHSPMTKSQSWWMLETLHSSTLHLRMPHRCSIEFRSGDMLSQSITFTLSSFIKAASSWRWVWGRYHVEILPYGPVSEGRGSCSASVCLSTFCHSWFPQWTVASQCQQHSYSPRPRGWGGGGSACQCSDRMPHTASNWSV